MPGQDLGALGDRELADWRAAHVGFVFQFYNLIPVLTAAENVELPLLLTAAAATASGGAHVDAALAAVGLTERRDHRPGAALRRRAAARRHRPRDRDRPGR